MSSNLHNNKNQTVSVDEIDENTAYVPVKGSTALEGVGTNPSGKKFDDNVAYPKEQGSTALGSVGTNPLQAAKSEVADKKTTNTSIKS
ncbi:12917_t:CDS:2 [Acaulospora morrowiae]|uniref:12917_t:CDS:1 n=1 Tax=Acaulospora morrowiae TaxID=94023 RepID=A0A9N8W609_9GLOM|nr:12917_t:CDS:2 [Acaulospora morrowiae]